MNYYAALTHLGYGFDDYSIIEEGGEINVVYHGVTPPTQTELNSAELPGAKALKLAAIRKQANTIIEAKWPVWKQNNCNMGVYPATTLVECQSDIAAVIQASNTAEDQVDAATTTTEVEAVTPVWPVI